VIEQLSLIIQQNFSLFNLDYNCVLLSRILIYGDNLLNFDLLLVLAIWAFRFLFLCLPSSRWYRNHFWFSLTSDLDYSFLFLNHRRLLDKLWLLDLNLYLFLGYYWMTRFRLAFRALRTVSFLLFLFLHFCHWLGPVSDSDHSIISIYLPLASILSIHTLLVVILILSITEEIKFNVKRIEAFKHFFLFKVKFFINDLTQLLMMSFCYFLVRKISFLFSQSFF